MTQKIQDQQFTDKRALLPFLKRLLAYATKQKQWFRLFMFTIIMVGIFDAIYPLIWRYYLDEAIIPLLKQYAPLLQKGITPTVDVWQIAGFASLFILTGSMQVIGVYFFVKYAGYIQEQVMYELRQQMFVRLQQLSFSFFDRSAQGWLLSRITSDTERVTELGIVGATRIYLGDNHDNSLFKCHVVLRLAFGTYRIAYLTFANCPIYKN
jgi:ATP-binding cassette subfamily B protein